ncbi:hypothetical protein [Vibrio coralliilyticus]|uniref:hypothetical protein n=1 Tax=Vibrio coralliilyticus TaxID=190893 RepID=UPI0017F65C83|nr:hypothetical protein [Vibrio coralliilyticus]NUW69550.1 hypothetical protein [Vibrio coralliilyticus]
MYIEGFFLKNQKKTESIFGTNVYVSEGHQVEVVCLPSNHKYTLRRGDQIRLPDGITFEKVQLTNLWSDEDISVACIHGDFVPSLDGTKINVAADLEAENLEVRFESRQPVELLPTQKIRAEITNLDNPLPVSVDNLPKPIDVQKVKVVDQLKPATKFIAQDTMTATGTISGNTKRQELWLSAAAGNPQSIWLGGYEGKGFELPPEAKLILNTTSEIEVLIPTDCQLLVAEEVIV